MQTYLVDSFTDTPFKGNPAGVCIVKESLVEQRMQDIATELGLSETAFVVSLPEGENQYAIRFFSPKKEIPLCGHATLASAKIVGQLTGCNDLTFTTQHGLLLKVKIERDDIILEFPLYTTEPASVSEATLAALGLESVRNAGYNREVNALLLELESTDILRALRPDYTALVNSRDDISGIAVTARGNDEFDFHSRYFWPWSGTTEDPVTGAIHTFLADYWSGRLGKTHLLAYQASTRGGVLDLNIQGDVLLIKGKAVVVLEGELKV